MFKKLAAIAWYVNSRDWLNSWAFHISGILHLSKRIYRPGFTVLADFRELNCRTNLYIQLHCSATLQLQSQKIWSIRQISSNRCVKTSLLLHFFFVRLLKMMIRVRSRDGLERVKVDRPNATVGEFKSLWRFMDIKPNSDRDFKSEPAAVSSPLKVLCFIKIYYYLTVKINMHFFFIMSQYLGSEIYKFSYTKIAERKYGFYTYIADST